LKSISTAPKKVESILEDLRFLKTLLARIQETDELLGADIVRNDALEKCKKSIDALTSLVNSLVPGFTSQSNIKRKWTGVEAVMKTGKILKFKTSLQEAKFDLIAAKIVSLQQVHSIVFQVHALSIMQAQ